ncbi:antibiotic biosynthesis monooxygenase [Streptomyces sp. V3I8]|uniref:antibiotic biosynthesis monooxygenase family protein n=1 Tax=Streptomyces sp. V3I8 TaxID=3042279 RepID=UPI0027D8D39D|nr:antibiotic biosynthesis monooxygenase [Streptomyces sp. V3I8]
MIIHHQARDEDEWAAIQQAYRQVSSRLAGVPGLLGNELMRSAADPSSVAVVSRWRDLAAFQEWEQGGAHRETTASLRPYRDSRLPVPFGVYRIEAAYH